ncbi:MAG: hypothetical protein AB7K37_01525 [Cyclobacteriaceae bacterium]
MLKLFRRISLTIYIIVVVIGFFYAMLQYLKLAGFKRALVELVEAETKGEYTLSIRDSDLDVFNLNFILHEVEVKKVDPNDLSGIQSVTIPYVQVKINSIQSYFKTRHFDIRYLVIREPVIGIKANKQQASKDGGQGRLTEQFLKLYPPIESIFQRFSINTLTILKGELNISRQEKELISLRLIDILFLEWNRRNISDSSALQITIGEQGLNFGNSSLAFSSVQYNFPAHRLIFTDYKFETSDSVSASWLEVTGKTLMVKSLNYDELYENHRYRIEKVEVAEPNLKGRLRLRGDNRNIDERDVVTRILKQVIGECAVDSTIIQNANLQLILLSNNDSVNVQLPKVGFEVYGFGVTADSNSFQLDRMQIGVEATEISLNEDLRVVSDRVSFNDQRTLTISNARFYQISRRGPIITCSEVALKQFNLLAFAFYKQVLSDGVNLRQADIHVSPEILSQLRRQRRQRPPGQLELDIPSGTFQQVNFYFTDPNQSLALKNTSGRVRQISKDAGDFISLDVLQMDAHDVEFRNPGRNINAVANGLSYQNGEYAVGYVQGKLDSLEFLVDHIRGFSSGPVLQNDFTDWEKIQLGRIELSGQLPRLNEQRPMTNIRSKILTTQQLIVNITSNGDRLAFVGSQIQVDHFYARPDSNRLDKISGRLTKLDLLGQGYRLRADSVRLQSSFDYPVYGVNATTDHLNVNSPFILFKNLQQDSLGWKSDQVRLQKLSVVNLDNELFTDSVWLNLPRLYGTKPTAARATLFRPFITISGNESKGGDPPTIDLVNDWTLTPGQITFGEHVVHTGAIKLNADSSTLKCDSLFTKQGKFYLRARGISMTEQMTTISSFELNPIQAAFATIEEEHDLIQGKFTDISFAGDPKKIVQDGNVQIDKLDVGEFQLQVARDKQLPDQQAIDKPFLLENLLKPPTGIRVQQVNAKNGTIVYCEIAEQSGQQGCVEIQHINAQLTFDQGSTRRLLALANASIYNSGTILLNYESRPDDQFALVVEVNNLELTKLNKMVSPLQMINIRSGFLRDYQLKIIADREMARGSAVLSYRDLHLDFYKKGKPEKKSKFLTFLAELFIRNSRERSKIAVNQPRIRSKSIFNYWVKSATNGALNAVRKGKSVKEE